MAGFCQQDIVAKRRGLRRGGRATNGVYVLPAPQGIVGAVSRCSRDRAGGQTDLQLVPTLKGDVAGPSAIFHPLIS